MDWQTVASSFIILCGAAVMLYSIIKLRMSFEATSFVPVRSRSSIKRLLRFHRLLMIFFLLAYIVVACAYLFGLQFVSEVFVSAVFFFGAVFVLLGIMLQSRMFSEIQVTVQDMEDTLRDLRTLNEELWRQTSQLRATAEIARVGSSTLDPAALSREVVEHVQDGFRPLGVYFVGLFLLDEARQNVVLRAATGEAGRLLLDMGYAVRVDETTTIGWSIIHQQARVAQNLEEGSVRLDALPMPHTRSEIALPLRSRERILGAMTMQSTREAAFADTDLATLQMMADLVATAIDNARLLTQTRAALEEVQAAHRRYLIQAWREFLATKTVSQVEYRQPGVEIGDGDLLRQTQRAAVAHQRTVAASSPVSASGEGASSPQAALVVPLKLRGQVIGTVALHETRRQRPWTADEVALAETIAEQVALTVENLRLMDETQRGVVRERAIREISDQMQRAADMETLVRVAAEELNRILGGSRTYVRLSPEALLLSPESRQVDEG